MRLNEGLNAQQQHQPKPDAKNASDQCAQKLFPTEDLDTTIDAFFYIH
jgi:hypothetical protein